MRKYIFAMMVICLLTLLFAACNEDKVVSNESSQYEDVVVGSWSWEMSCTFTGNDTTTRETCDCWKMINFDANNHYEYYTSETGSITPELEGNYTVRYEFVDFFGGQTDILRMSGFPCSMKIEIGDNNRLRLSENCNETSMTECAWHVYHRRNQESQ